MSDPSSTAAIADSATGSRRPSALLILAVALIQSAVLGWMIYDRINLLETGKEILLDVVPVDPRSLFRGDYVILTYPISRIATDVQGANQDFRHGETVFVTLRRGGTASEGGAAHPSWDAVAIARQPPANLGPDEVFLRGRVRHMLQPPAVDYGIESYFVPEGEGKELEKQVRERKLQVLVAVAPDGEAAIKGLMIDGKLRYEEPLF